MEDGSLCCIAVARIVDNTNYQCDYCLYDRYDSFCYENNCECPDRYDVYSMEISAQKNCKTEPNNTLFRVRLCCGIDVPDRDADLIVEYEFAVQSTMNPSPEFKNALIKYFGLIDWLKECTEESYMFKPTKGNVDSYIACVKKIFKDIMSAKNPGNAVDVDCEHMGKQINKKEISKHEDYVSKHKQKKATKK